MRTEAEIRQKIEEIRAKIARDHHPETWAQTQAVAKLAGSLNGLEWVLEEKDDQPDVDGIGAEDF